MAWRLDQDLASAPSPAQPRAEGAVHVSARLRGTQTRLARLRQQGSAKALLPRGEGFDIVLLNTAGGITGGDRFDWTAEAGPGTKITLTTQAAERAYRAQPGQTGHSRSRLSAGPGARIDWLPQETILFDRSALARSLDADLAEDATLLAAEAVILGRSAMGERLSRFRFADQWRIRRGGRLIYADALRLSETALAGPAALAGHRALASLMLAGPGAGRLLAPLRACLPQTAGASLITRDVLAARILAPDGFTLRRALIPALELLRAASLPKPWTI